MPAWFRRNPWNDLLSGLMWEFASADGSGPISDWMQEQMHTASRRICWNDLQLSVQEAFKEASAAIVKVFRSFDIKTPNTLVEFMACRNRRAKVDHPSAPAAVKELLQDAAAVDRRVDLLIIA